MKITIHTDGGGLPTKPSIRQWFRNMANGISVSRNKDVIYAVTDLENEIFRDYVDNILKYDYMYTEITCAQEDGSETVIAICNYLN